MLELARELERREDFEESWKSAYIKGVVHFINGNGDAAEEYFTEAWQTAPRSAIWSRILLGRMEKYFGTTQRAIWSRILLGRTRKPKIFEGKIGSDLTSTEGHIYEHGIEGWDKDIYFNPAEQDTRPNIKSGMKVNFELGFP